MKLLFMTDDFNKETEYGLSWSFIEIPGFQIDKGLLDKMKSIDNTAYDVNSERNIIYQIDGDYYFTITGREIQGIIRRIIDGRYYFHSDPWFYALPSGIFRTDGKTIENLLPIELNTDSNIYGMAYIPQTRCFALSVGEKTDDDLIFYVYIYHLETGVAEKHRVAAYLGNNDRVIDIFGPYLFVSDNLLVAYAGSVYACIETDKTAGSIMLNRILYLDDIVIDANPFAYDWNLVNDQKCFLSREDYFYIITKDHNYGSINYHGSQDNIFEGYILYIHAFKESELVFSGYMVFSQQEQPAAFSISDKMPLVTENGLTVMGYAHAYNLHCFTSQNNFSVLRDLSVGAVSQTP